MCGIAGMVGDTSEEHAHEVLENMLLHMTHRGPDGHGRWHSSLSAHKKIFLGHRRLAIVDLHPRSNQPMVSKQYGHVLVFNGEIYNHQDLRTELTSYGCLFETTSDTEVLLHAWSTWGPACLNKLKGMFASALWDPHTQTLYLARDYAGIKPLYYTHHHNQCAFASEVRALSHTLTPDTSTLSAQALAGYCAYGSFQEPLTAYKNIHSLPSGCYAVYRPQENSFEIKRYWFMPHVSYDLHQKVTASDEEELDHLLQTSVQRHLLSDVPMALFLSGGIDSTVLAGYIHEQKNAHIQAFTVGFNETSFNNEILEAQKTCAHFGIPHTTHTLTAAESLSLVLRFLSSSDLPSMDGLNVYTVSSLLHSYGYKAAISGQGSDELFGGYPSFLDVPKTVQFKKKYDGLSHFFPHTTWYPFNLIFSFIHQEKIRDMAECSTHVSDIYLQRRRSLPNTIMTLLGFEAKALELQNSFIPYPEKHDTFISENDIVSHIARLEYQHYLQNTLLRDGDSASMASSVEVRVPFLDKDIVEWCFKKRGFYFIHKKIQKYILKKTAHRFLRKEQLKKSKKGFVFPLQYWMQNELKDLCQDSIKHLKECCHINPSGIEYIEKIFQKEPHSPFWSRYWSIVTLGYWLKHHHPQNNFIQTKRKAG